MVEKPEFHLSKPLMVFDGDCNFCRYWILRWRIKADQKVDFSPYQETADRFPSVSKDQFRHFVHFIEPDGTMTSGAHGVFRFFDFIGQKKWLRWLYSHLPGFSWVSEFVYGLVARHRRFFSFWTRLFWGKEIHPPQFGFVSLLFTKTMAVIYGLAFVSLWVQIDGLIGPQGILPADQFLNAVAERYGPERFYLLPTVFWWGAGTTALHMVCALGLFFSLLLFFGLIPVLSSAVVWILYLSLVSVGRDFLSFQWDVLLLEAGFLLIFLCPIQWIQTYRPKQSPSLLIIFLFQWLLFRLMVMSGLVKILSGDASWANLTALNVHYQTQPIPSGVSWFVHHLPTWFHRWSTIGMFGIELVIPFLLFGPRRVRALASLFIAGLMVIILLTGNYCFFNWLTLALCLLMLDDSFWSGSWKEKAAHFYERFKSGRRWPKPVLLFVFVGALIMTSYQMTQRLQFPFPWPSVVRSLSQSIGSFHLFNSYGLFSVMTTTRPEIIIEGSMDGIHWEAYEFKYKPGNLMRRPPFVAPHQPRLDWQMWFAALSSADRQRWFQSLIYQLFNGNKTVSALLEKNPFEDQPPLVMRAVVYDYTFTDVETRRSTGRWWNREEKGYYLPPVKLK